MGSNSVPVFPTKRFSVVELSPHSDVFVFPTTIAPARLRWATNGDFESAIWSSRRNDPDVVRISSTSARSFIPNGNPWSD
jgi:hypothetical protein